MSSLFRHFKSCLLRCSPAPGLKSELTEQSPLKGLEQPEFGLFSPFSGLGLVSPDFQSRASEQRSAGILLNSEFPNIDTVSCDAIP